MINSSLAQKSIEILISETSIGSMLKRGHIVLLISLGSIVFSIIGGRLINSPIIEYIGYVGIGTLIFGIISLLVGIIVGYTFIITILYLRKKILAFTKIDCSIENINEILMGINSVKLVIKILGTLHPFLRIFYPETRKNFGECTKATIAYLLLVLLDLRSDLSIRLAEQQSTLESAKSEVEKNITGTTELNQVSELQRARLDRQIEQFEELQRVLVKV